MTTVQNQTIDAGGYVAQQVVTPGQLQYGLQWQRNAYAVPGPFGLFARVRGAPVLAPQLTPPTVQTQLAYRPNYINQQVAQTSYMPQVQQVQVPVQVQRMQTEMVTQNVPVQTTRMQTEMVTQNVPVQTTRMIPTTEVRKVPYVVQRPVTETLTRKVPVTQQRWVTEEKVRKVPVQSTKMIYETYKRPVEVQYYEQEAVTQTVRRPVTRQKYVPYTETVMVPKQVVQRYPLSYYDPFSPAIMSGYSSFSNPSTSISSPPIDYAPSIAYPSTSPSVSSSKVVVQPEDSGPSVLEAPKSHDDEPMTRMKKIEMGEIESATPGSESKSAEQLELTSPADEDILPLPKPELEASEAGWRIQWNPVYAREA